MQPLNQNSNSPFQSIFEALEERVLFDGVPDAAIVLPADAATEVPAQVESLQQADLDAPRELIVVDPGVENSEGPDRRNFGHLWRQHVRDPVARRGCRRCPTDH